jgi:hypothetical protein
MDCGVFAAVFLLSSIGLHVLLILDVDDSTL